MIFTVLDIQFTKEQLRKLISMTDTNKDGRIDMKEFHDMLYAEDIAQMAAANQSDDEDIQIVEEVSNESDDDNNNEDEEIKAEIRAGMLANREKVM